jgi:hypothetical protein
MHAPADAQVLRERGHDVVAVADDPTARSMTDEELFTWAAERGRRIVTENVKDFRRILARAEETGATTAALQFTSSRTFPRSRKNPGPLIEALDGWLRRNDLAERPIEDWLRPGSADHTTGRSRRGRR